MDTEILKTLLKQAADNSVLLARIDERVGVLTEKADKSEERDEDHEARISLLEEGPKHRKWLLGVVIGVGTVAGVAEAVSRFL